jgi:hypothetical protein
VLIVIDVLGNPTGPIFKGQGVGEELARSASKGLALKGTVIRSAVKWWPRSDQQYRSWQVQQQAAWGRDKG